MFLDVWNWGCSDCCMLMFEYGVVLVFGVWDCRVFGLFEPWMFGFPELVVLDVWIVGFVDCHVVVMCLML